MCFNSIIHTVKIMMSLLCQFHSPFLTPVIRFSQFNRYNYHFYLFSEVNWNILNFIDGIIFFVHEFHPIWFKSSFSFIHVIRFHPAIQFQSYVESIHVLYIHSIHLKSWILLINWPNISVQPYYQIYPYPQFHPCWEFHLYHQFYPIHCFHPCCPLLYNSHYDTKAIFFQFHPDVWTSHYYKRVIYSSLPSWFIFLICIYFFLGNKGNE